ncbi:MAG TPA: hypothetical protein VGM03_08365 [Phycisphaerae bacterium]|jgi:phosphoglycolate phosphatase-like HAD superfamily hydrolase
MRIIIDCDGPVVNVEPVYCAAYEQAAGELGLPRLDRAAYWRLQRAGGEPSAILRGARPGQLRDFEARFRTLLEADATWESATAQPGVTQVLSDLRSSADLFLTTLGTNRGARQRCLDAAGASIYFSRMAALGPAGEVRVRRLRELMEGDRRGLLVAASEELIRAARSADAITIGVAAGPCVAQRLTRAGAAHVYADLQQLQEAVRTSADDLLRAGLNPADGRC